MRELKYSFEYFCSPIWVKKNTDDIFENVSIDTIPISDELKKEINELDVIYQSTYNENYPPEPIKLLKHQEFLFKMRVINSLKQLSEELADNYSVLSSCSKDFDKFDL